MFAPDTPGVDEAAAVGGLVVVGGLGGVGGPVVVDGGSCGLCRGVSSGTGTMTTASCESSTPTIR